MIDDLSSGTKKMSSDLYIMSSQIQLENVNGGSAYTQCTSKIKYICFKFIYSSTIKIEYAWLNKNFSTIKFEYTVFLQWHQIKLTLIKQCWSWGEENTVQTNSSSKIRLSVVELTISTPKSNSK